MSWEDSSPIARPCPCGMGQYFRIIRSDDWNRYEEQWEMHCPSCKKKYGLYAKNYSRKGMVSPYQCWLPHLVLEELAVATEELKQAEKTLSAYATAHYQEQWNNHFIGKKKKTVWRELTEDGKCYPSLSTFYLHIRESSLEQQLARYFNYRELPTLVRVLKLNASELYSRIEQVHELEHLLEERHSNARQQGFV
ncbi:MAG: hypothetical protein PHS51_08480 [Gallionella sp.]|nr:hypothetical protein [Gallionella sp.]